MTYEKISKTVHFISGFFKPNASEQLFHAVEMADHRLAEQLVQAQPKLMLTKISADKLNRHTQPLQGLELSPLQLACFNYDMALLNSFSQAIANDPRAKNEFSMQLYLFKNRYSIEPLKKLYEERSWKKLMQHQKEEMPVVFLKEFCTRANWYEGYDFSIIKHYNEPVSFTDLDNESSQLLIKDSELNFTYALCRHEQYKICSCIVEAPIGSMMEDLAGFISLHEQRQQQLNVFLTEVNAVAATPKSMASSPTENTVNHRCAIL